ncbi:MAG: HlyD family efflux transporter periplasmic adaptor subunit [Planctomycetota bacterium]
MSDHDLEAAEFRKSRVAIPPAVRRNLGMTFAIAEARSVSQILWVPGKLEIEPSARRRYSAPAQGRLEVLVRELDLVNEGDSIYTLTSKGEEKVTVNAEASGRVLSLLAPSGGWTNEHAPVLDMVDPSRLRFRGRALQGDLSELRDGMTVRVLPEGASSSVDLTAQIEGTLLLGLTGDSVARTLDVFATLSEAPRWARPDAAARIEVTTAESAPTCVAVPVGAVREDGLDRVLFRRDPNRPDEVARVKVTLGSSDGRWIEVLEGVDAGDEVVVDGSFQLLYAGDDAGLEKGGHFHADGTYHAGGH